MLYILMNKEIEVVEFTYDEETHTIVNIERSIHLDFAPLGILEYKAGTSKKSFNAWWNDRSIPSSRSKFKDVMEELNITSSMELLERCFGLSLSDQYWIKEKNSTLKWANINFFENDFSEDMGKLLMGQMPIVKTLDMCSPDNSSDGNLCKKWKVVNGKRCLVKGGNTLNNQEPFNEVIATKLYERILEKGEFVPYYLLQENDNVYSYCETMVTTNEELVSAFYIDATQRLKGSDSLYEHYLNACANLGIMNARSKVNKMIICDYIIANYDRHYRNFGAIRNINSLAWVGISPIFDSGSSLWATTPTSALGAPYKSKPFKAHEEEQLQLVQDLSWLDIDKLKGFEQDVIEVLKLNSLMDDTRIDAIATLVKARIKHVIECKENLALIQ